jgi:hypothetical protein
MQVDRGEPVDQDVGQNEQSQTKKGIEDGGEDLGGLDIGENFHGALLG